MRRIALLGSTLLLAACTGSGFGTFLGDTQWHSRPNKPLGASENMERVRGESPGIPVLRPEPGDVWPGPPPPQPTLQQLMKEENQQTIKPLPLPVVPGAPTPIPPMEPTMPEMPKVPGTVAPRLTKPPPGAHVYKTPAGPMFGVPGPGGYETLTGPQGQTGGIVVPNGNGTSTIIMPNGQVLSVPTPK